MNYSLIILEMAVVAVGLGLLLADLWIAPERRRMLGLAGAGALTLILLWSFGMNAGDAQFAFGKMYVFDGLALFFKPESFRN